MADDCGDLVRLDEPSVSPDQRNSVADSLLSKHNGWITIDDENRDRKQAPETYQNTNPMQRNRLKPSWMRTAVNQSLDIERYKKFAIDLNSKNGQPGDANAGGVFDVRRSMNLDAKKSK